ncbi:MAG: hypothetical protein EOM12_14800 [Verrucomicrobiae bacterium]|nr:hypothetical protein [Verrucomicrobiae bacterium]
MNALKILKEVDCRMDKRIDLTLYGRAAIQLGYRNPPKDTLLSLDVDAIFWNGQAEWLNEQTLFWDVIEQVNQCLASDGLYISHFFTEDQVILKSNWKENRLKLDLPFEMLEVYRLSDIDLLLSKLMRDDPQDLQDALFIIQASHLTERQIREAMKSARIPEVADIQEQYKLASQRLLSNL